MIYSCIDIGTDTIKMVTARVKSDSIHILGAVNTRMSGIKKGLIHDPELVKKSINLANEEMAKVLGFKIDKAIVNVPFYDVSVDVYRGECYPGDIITGDDVINCFKSGVRNVDKTREVITVFPIDWKVDKEKCDDPKGMTGEKLECRMLISSLPKEVVYPYLEILDSCHIEVIDLSFDTVNTFYAMNNKKFNDICGAVVNIGASKSEIAIFNKGLMIKGDVLPLGSKLVDNDISYMYHVDKATSRFLKENFAFACSAYADVNEKMEYDILEGEKLVINQQEISQVVEARLDEILKTVKNSLKNLTNHEISYIIVSGGISNLPGFEELANKTFPEMAYSVNLKSLGARNNIYISCIGMLRYYYDKLKIRGIDYTMYSKISEMIKDKKKELRDKIIDDMKKYCEDN